MNPSDDSLAAALARHGIALPEEQIARLDQYCRLLWDWNTKINLTRHDDYEKFAARDVLDSLTIARFLRPGEAVLDVGSGGGVPGVILAVVRPELKVSLAESVAKKARVLDDIVGKLGLDVPVFHARTEDVLADRRFDTAGKGARHLLCEAPEGPCGQKVPGTFSGRFDTLTVRAVARLAKLLTWFRPHWDAFGRLLVLKGPSWVEERGEARHLGLLKTLALRKLAEYPLPGTESQSVLLQICPRERAEELRVES